MAAIADNAVADGDPAFNRVDTRTPAHLLPVGVAADATNKRFDDGRAKPRFNVQQGPWGIVRKNLIPVGAVYDMGGNYHADNLFVPGRNYLIVNNEVGLSVGITDQAPIAILASGASVQHVAVEASWLIHCVNNKGHVNVAVYEMRTPNECGYQRFNDPQGFDVTLVATDDWRDYAGEDGGRGRVWKILANNAPVEVPLNGQDIDGTARFVPCFNALALLRHGNEKHYFSAAAVGAPSANKIQLNGPQAWNNGDQVYLWGDANSAITGTSAPASGSFCFVKKLAANAIELYADANLTQLLAYTTAVGRFYLERRAAAPGQFGNGAPPLLAQPDSTGKTLWEVGFNPVPVNLAVINTVAATGVWTVPNHRLKAGDAVTLADMPGGHTPANGAYFAFPLNDHQLQLFDTQVNALLAVAVPGSVTGLKVVSNDGETLPTMKKTGASGLPMPPATEGFYTENNRLVLVNGKTLLISDTLDPLHYAPQTATLPADLGESDLITGVASFISADVLVIAKQKSILALYNFSGGAAAWALRNVTREYGCLSALSLRQWGSRLVFQSRRGLDSVYLTANGVVLPMDQPLSWTMKKYVDRFDWNQAAKFIVETHDNRLFWGVRLKTGAAGTANNALLVLNFLNSDPTKGVFGWEGVWTGALLAPAGFARHTITGEERLTFVSASGQVYWLGDGALDAGNVPIADSLTTRLYTGTDDPTAFMGRKVWLKSLFVWDTNHALLTVTAKTPGYNELSVLTPDGGFAYDATKYAAGESADYNPATQVPPFSTPLREDYALQNVTELIGGIPDVLQNHSEPFRLREDDWAVQFIIANARGTACLQSVNVSGFMGPSSDRSRV